MIQEVDSDLIWAYCLVRFEVLDDMSRFFLVELRLAVGGWEFPYFHGLLQLSDSPSHRLVALPSNDCGMLLD